MTAAGDEGYLILATGPAKYIEMARNLAASIRVMDPARRICLVHDEHAVLAVADAKYFDDQAVLPDDPVYPGFMNKIRLYPTSPYRRTMFVDADCLMVKRDVDRWWRAAEGLPFAIGGNPQRHGEWKGADVAQLLRQEGAPYLVQMNSGVFCFDDSPQARDFFTGLNDFYLRRKDFLCVGLHRGAPAQTDEIYIGLWMGLNNMLGACRNSREQGQDMSWMVSTWRGFGIRMDPARDIARLRKPRRSTMGIPNPLGGWDLLSPTVLHCIGLKPAPLYRRLAAYFRARVG